MVEASAILEQDALSWFDDLYTLNGVEATYKRYEEETYDPDSGSTISYDTGTVSAIIAPIRSYQLMQDSRLQTDDRRIIFKQSDFPYNTTKGVNKPTGNDKIVVDNNTWKLDLEGDTIYETDDTNTLYFIYMRKDNSG